VAVRRPRGKVRIGISGFDYPRWRKTFYPESVPRKQWLAHASRLFPSIELNGTFYSLKNPRVFEHWVAETPDEDFTFAVKGGRFITHNLKLKNCDVALGNFFASGVLALGEKTGPLLWQLPATYRFEHARVEGFLRALPRTTKEAEQVARRHDARLKHGALTGAPVDLPLRHALEPRHPSYFTPECYELLRTYGCALVIADTAGVFPTSDELTADFVYVRLHGGAELYVSGYTDAELDGWAERIRAWSRGGRDVYVYFDNDAKVHAPWDALKLTERVRAA